MGVRTGRKYSRVLRSLVIIFGCMLMLSHIGCGFVSDSTTAKATSAKNTERKDTFSVTQTVAETTTETEAETDTETDAGSFAEYDEAAAAEESLRASEEASRAASEEASREEASRLAAEEAARREASEQASREEASREAARIASEQASREAASRAAATNPPHRTITVTSGLTFRRNQYATLSINAQPGVVYYIAVYYNSGASTAEGLVPKQADGAGNVSWTWQIGGRTAPGTYRVEISGNGEMIIKYITVIVD